MEKPKGLLNRAAVAPELFEILLAELLSKPGAKHLSSHKVGKPLV